MPLQISLAHQFEQQQDETLEVHFSPDGNKLVSLDGKALYLWQLNEHGSWSYWQSLPFCYPSNPRFTPNSNTIAFRDENRYVRLISLADGNEIAILSCPATTDFAFSPDQHWLVTGDTARNILAWDLRTYEYSLIPVRFPPFRGDSGVDETAFVDETISGFQFTHDGQRLIFRASSAEGDLHICHVDLLQKRLIRQKTFSHGCIDLAISSNGKMLAMIVSNEQVYAYKQNIYIYDLESLQLLHVFPQITKKRYCLLAFSPDSRYLMSCKSDGWIDIFSLDSFDCIAQFAAHPGLSSHASDPIGGLDWSKTGYIATGGASVFEHDTRKTDYSIKLWKVEDVEVPS